MAKKKPLGPVQMSGSEFREFWSDPVVWGAPDAEDAGYYDDEEITLNGRPLDCDVTESTVPDSATVVIVYARMEDGPNDGEDMADVARKWLASREYRTISFRVHRDILDAVTKAVKDLGGDIA